MNGRIGAACVLVCCVVACDVTEPTIVTTASGTIYFEGVPAPDWGVILFGVLPGGEYLGSLVAGPAASDSSGYYSISVELPEKDCRRIARVALYSSPLPGSWRSTPFDGHPIQCGEQLTGLDFQVTH